MSNIFRILLITFILASVGCSTKEPIIRYEYIQVEVPVMYKLERPSRPKLIKQSTPGYISELLTYIRVLEVIIDETNIKGK